MSLPLSLFFINLMFLTHLQSVSSSLLLPFEISFNADKIKFYSISTQGVPHEIKLLDNSSLQFSPIKRKARTIIVIHGFAVPTSFMLANRWLIRIYMKKYQFGDNLILVDWSALSTRGYNIFDSPFLYPMAVGNVAKTGDRVAHFIKWMHSEGAIDFDGIHLIGISLGAHVAGHVGTAIQQTNGGKKISRITGLDPAGPLYYPSHQELNLDKTDANFVDIYHSNMGLYGGRALDGHVDFIINNGRSQPGCNTVTDIFFCSHNFATFLFADTIKKSYVACKCSPNDENDQSLNQCPTQCPNPVNVGLHTSNSTRGVYRISARNVPQYFRTIQLD
ncbi:lipase member H [Folsomia candida]|uniref:Lipase member H n=1 Tax=Folsomia candida TaxID=158441 RepID=A0A226DF93_FOLCA|nr:lipase member H [Folsomia candida]OXA44245.1 Lipase member H [Folsomia candida]